MFQAVRVPGQVVVDHQVGALQVDAFAGGVGGQQHLYLRVVPERFLRRQAFLAAHAALDDDHRRLAAEQGCDALLQVAQRVPVLGEDHQLLTRRGRRTRDRTVAVANRRLPGPAGAVAWSRMRLGVFDLLFRRVVEILDVVRVELRSRERDDGRGLAALLEHFELAQAALQPLAPAPQRLVDRLGRRGEPALQDRQRETDRARPLGVGERLGAIELLAHVVGDGRVEVGFRGGEPVRHGVGDPLRKQRLAVELQQPLLDHAPHQVRDVGRVDPVAEAALEAVAVEQGEEELEVLLLAVVRRRRHQQEVAGQA